MGILSDENAMCDEYYRNDNCDQCPINMAAKAKMTSCVVYKINNEEEATKMIEEWKAKHKTLIPESLKKTLKGIYNLGYKTVSRKSFNGVYCATSQGVATVFPNSLNTEFSILLPKAEYKIADLIDATFLEDLKATIENEDNEENINKFDKSMLQNGRFVLTDDGCDEDWGIVYKDRIIYRYAGWNFCNDNDVKILKIVEHPYGFESITEGHGKTIYERKE